ncbi:hypothetical protein H310_06776 [Aphanomyces invadans]|uniref:Methyltransferase type 11 domain-containing protein n=1 Tax=Aphanomyces invadans TaxID=157072 RepID=A0A024U6D1_9STRA|nr:hypothetical protein H310_06776 [Aphanomyces invadans]ETW01178.1 hypothetical protein H310_06776 [Aphanomyces invadans]|eukprot:XP_008870176.1 hypothetical protein H310_06776 [Aphanomyces invadans]
MEDALSRHETQFNHYAVPSHLRETALRKVMENDVTAPWILQDNAVVVAAEEMASEADVWVLDHLWLFQTAKDAADQLKGNDSLREEMLTISRHFAKSSSTNKDIDSLVEWIVVHLVHCAYSIKFGHTASDVYHYVLANVGSMLECAKDNAAINVQVAPLYYMDEGRLVSLMWAVQPIAKGDKLVRPHATKISLIQLGKQTYWETRYEEEDEFDWYCGYEHLKDVLRRHVQPSQTVLLAGTGASTLPIDMIRDGFTNVVAIDYAANVVEKVRAKYSSSRAKFIQADMTNMEGFDDGSFNCILDKGCLDTMLLAPETQVESNVWKTVTPDNAAEFNEASAVMRECMRLLAPDGIFLLISYGSPTNRIGLLDWPTDVPGFVWEVLECLELSPTNSGSIAQPFFIYVLQKQVVGSTEGAVDGQD